MAPKRKNLRETDVLIIRAWSVMQFQAVEQEGMLDPLPADEALVMPCKSLKYRNVWIRHGRSTRMGRSLSRAAGTPSGKLYPLFRG